MRSTDTRTIGPGRFQHEYRAQRIYIYFLTNPISSTCSRFVSASGTHRRPAADLTTGAKNSHEYSITSNPRTSCTRHGSPVHPHHHHAVRTAACTSCIIYSSSSSSYWNLHRDYSHVHRGYYENVYTEPCTVYVHVYKHADAKAPACRYTSDKILR